MIGAAIFFALANLADLVSTLFALKRGAKEMNPLARKVIDNFGNGGLAVYKLVCTLLFIGFADAVDAQVLLWGLGGILFVVAGHNHFGYLQPLINRIKGRR
jgi:hypothetical protein